MTRRRGLQESTRGMVTAEMAFAFLGVGAAAVLLVGMGGLGVAQLRCSDLATAVAREVARDDLGAVPRVEEQLPDATVTVATEDGLIVVRVALDAQPWGAWLPPIHLRAEARSVPERPS